MDLFNGHYHSMHVGAIEESLVVVDTIMLTNYYLYCYDIMLWQQYM